MFLGGSRRVRPDCAHFIPFHSMSFHVIPFHSLSFPFIPFHSLSFPFIPFHSLSFPFIPFPFIPPSCVWDHMVGSGAPSQDLADCDCGCPGGGPTHTALLCCFYLGALGLVLLDACYLGALLLLATYLFCWAWCCWLAGAAG